MKRLEIIHLRSPDKPPEALERQILESIQASSEGTPEVRLYRRHGLETDLAVHIYRVDAPAQHEPSRLGLRLAASLGTLGLVKHSVWEETE